jgi:hypothetical protein
LPEDLDVSWDLLDDEEPEIEARLDPDLTELELVDPHEWT